MTTSESRHDDPAHDESSPDESFDRDAPLPEDTDGLTDEEIVAELEGDELDTLRRERDEAVLGRQRALADFVNLQRRARETEQRARTMGVAQLARALMPVLDQFEYALGDQSANASADDLRDGVRLVKDELAKALEQNGVKAIAPEVGEEFDPNRHEAMMRQPAKGVAPNHLTGVVQIGFALDELVLRPAKVMVAPSEDA